MTGLSLVKGDKPFPILPCPHQFHVRLYDIENRDLILYLLDRVAHVSLLSCEILYKQAFILLFFFKIVINALNLKIRRDDIKHVFLVNRI